MNFKILRAVPIVGLLLLTGAGCLGKSDAPVAIDGGVYRTANSGQDWQQLTALPGAKGVGSIGNLNFKNLEQDPQDPFAMYAGSTADGVFFSVDGGVTWQRPRPEALRTGAIADIEVDPKNVCTVYIAKGQRLLKSEACLRDVDLNIYVDTRANVTVDRVVVDWFDSKVVWIGLSNGDVLKSLDGGGSWSTVLVAKNQIEDILVSAKDSRQILVATKSSGFFRSEDGGVTWTQVEKELKALKKADSVYKIAEAQGGSIVMAATGYGLIRSYDFGLTWEPLTLLTSPGQVVISSLVLNEKDADIIYYTAGSAFYASADGGDTWTTENLPTARIAEDMLLDSSDGTVVYLAVAQKEK